MLTTKRRIFIEEYLKCWNATEAAKVAGYSHPGREGWRLLHGYCPEVEEAIKQRLSEKAMSADEVLMRLGDQARGTIEDFLIVDEEGWKIDLQKAMLAEKLGLIKSLWIDSNGNPRLELHDQQRALELLAKYHGLFSDATNVNVGVALGPQIIIDDGSESS